MAWFITALAVDINILHASHTGIIVTWAYCWSIFWIAFWLLPLFAHFLHFRCMIQIFRWDIRFLRFDILLLLYLSWLTKLVIFNPWAIKVWSGIIFYFYTCIQIDVLLNLLLNFLCKAKWVKLAIFVNNRRLC